jgi:O-antigen/teichoic acid export membrane protein
VRISCPGWDPRDPNPNVRELLGSRIGNEKLMLMFASGNSIRARLVRNTAWAVVGTGVYQALLVATSIITGRSLGGETFGQFGVVQSTTAMFGTFIGTALGLASTKHVAQYRDTDPARAGRIIGLCGLSSLALGTVASALLFALAQPLATGVFHSPSLIGPLQSASLLLLFHIWNGSQQGILAGFEAFFAIARINVVRGVCTVGLSTWALHYWKLPGAVWALTASAATACFLSTHAIRRVTMRRGLVVHWKTAWRERSILAGFSLPAVLTGAVIAPVTWGVSALLASQPNGYAQIGLFTAANHWRMAVCFVPGTLVQVTMPVLSNLLGIADKTRYTRTLAFSLLSSLVASLAAAVPIIALAKVIMAWYGVDFRSGVAPLVVLQVAAILTSLCSALGAAIACTGRMWSSFILNFVWGIILMVLVYGQNPRTAKGVAWAYVGAYAAHTIFQGLLLLRANASQRTLLWVENPDTKRAVAIAAASGPPANS